MHTVERFRRRDFGHMEIQLTIDDPKASSKSCPILSLSKTSARTRKTHNTRS